MGSLDMYINYHKLVEHMCRAFRLWSQAASRFALYRQMDEQPLRNI